MLSRGPSGLFRKLFVVSSIIYSNPSINPPSLKVIIMNRMNVKLWQVTIHKRQDTEFVPHEEIQPK